MLLSALVGAPLTACDAPSLPSRTVIDEPQRLAFRCVATQDAATGTVSGLPLEGCGCTRWVGEGDERRIDQLGRVECACRALLTGPGETNPCANGLDDDGDGLKDAEDDDCAPQTGTNGVAPPSTGEALADVCRNDADDDGDGLTDGDDPGCVTGLAGFEEVTVKRVLAECSGEGLARVCAPLRSDATGDWIPAWDPDEQNSTACEPAGQGLVRGYVGASGRGEVALLDLTDEHRILDVDTSIPGTTSVYVDDLVGDVEADPEGRFVFTVNTSTGTLSVVRNDDVSVAYIVDLGVSPLLEAWTDPPETATRARGEVTRRRPVAYITAPLSGEILEVSLDALEALRPAREGIEVDGERAIIRRITLAAVDEQGAPTGGDAPRPGPIGLDPDGEVIVVGHVDAAAVQVIDRRAPERQRTVSLFGGPCSDGYLADVLDLRTAGVCANGRDDDGDGDVDMADADCAAGLRWEAGRPPVCPRIARCDDGVDDDGDGLVDADDPDCVDGASWEGPVPACSDGRDNDADGLADRADPDCANEEDDDERGRELSTCNDGLDNNGDGRADGDDPACAVEQCDDAEDNDGDGLSDLDDEDCASADARLAVALPDEGGDEASPCANGEDDDGDGLADALDPGCRFLSAARRFAFEARAECANGADDDGDGLIDFGEDPDCAFAADSSEAGGRSSAGPAAVAVARYDLGGGQLGMGVYAVDRETGTLFGIDVGDDDPLSAPVALRRIDLPSGAQTVVARHTESGTSLLLTDADATLRSVEVTAPMPVVDAAGRPVFAHIVRNEGAGQGEDPFVVAAFYVVAQGRAWRVPSLDAWVSATGGRVFSADQVGKLARRVPLGLLPLPLPALVESDVGRADSPGTPLELIVSETDVSPRGLVDPTVVVSGGRRLLNAQSNPLTTAATRTNRLLAAPSLNVGAASGIQYDASVHPALCRTPSANDAPGICVPVGRDATGAPESPEDARARTATSVGTVQGVTVIEDDPERLPSDRFTLAYEGTLPGSESRSGQHAGVVERGGRAVEWRMVDYDRDFCRLGVEVGDVVLVDRFVPIIDSAADLPAVCRDLINRADTQRDVARFREPLRYTVRALTAHSLTLGAGLPGEPERTSYGAMVPKDAFMTFPTIPPAPPVPVAACAAQFVLYKIRAANDSWLLTGDRTGLRHPWVNRDGLCAAAPARASRSGRVALGVPFENEWFRFTLGYLQAPSDSGAAALGIPAGRSPYQIDTSITFDTTPGLATRSLSGSLVLPRDLRWLPVDDRLYVVDSALGTVVEFTGFDPYSQVLRSVRQFN